MLRVYVAGPYSADKLINGLSNIGRGIFMAIKVLKMNFAVFVPWLDCLLAIMGFKDDIDVELLRAHSMAWLKVSQAVLLVPGWQKSNGTLKEIEYAENHGIPVFERL